MREDLLGVARRAGETLLRYYGNSPPEVSYKSDGSPVTEADLASNEIIKKGLSRLGGYGIQSEEAPVSFEQRKDWKIFWLVDPLDGTREFLAKTDEFTVSIALVKNGVPILGVIYAPALNELFFAEAGKGAFLDRGAGPLRLPFTETEELAVPLSRFYPSEAVSNFIRENHIHRTLVVGSSLKFGRLAEGILNLYPRFSPSHEWDIAAGHVLIKESGLRISQMTTPTEPQYNKPDTRNAPFVVYSEKSSWEQLRPALLRSQSIRR